MPGATRIVHTDRLVEKAELIWKNGEFVPWDEANVHVLSHGLHYGIGRLRGNPLLRHGDRPGDLPPPGPPRPPRQVRRALLPAASALARGDPRGDQGADSPQRAAQLLHPPARLPRLRRDGPLREERPGRRLHRGLALGRLPRRGGQAATGIRAKVSSWRRISPAGLIPHAKASGPVPELDPRQDRERQRRLRRGDPARRARLRLRGLRREHLPRPRGRDRHPAATPPRSSTASTASR